MFAFFRPAAHQAPLPEEKIDSTYRRLRWQIFAGIFIGYAGYYLLRKNFSLAMPYLIDEGYSRGDLGLAMSAIAIAYGLKIWSNSPLARRVVLSQAIEDQPEIAAGATPRVTIGTLGIAETTLRPIGWIRIATHRHEALAEEGFIAAGKQVQVTGFDDATLRVRAVETA